MADLSPATLRSLDLPGLAISPVRPLVIVDVDEVLGLFMQGFGQFLESRGLEFRVDRFALFQNIYLPGATKHLDPAEGKRLFDDFFRYGCGDMVPTPGGVEALNALADVASIVIFTNAPPQARLSRSRWLGRHRMDYPLVLGSGPKGPVAALLAAQTNGPVVFVDDLLPNLASVAEHAPQVTRFQHVADARLRALAPSEPESHPRFDDWSDLHTAIRAAIG